MFSTNAPASLVPHQLSNLFFVADLSPEKRLHLQHENAYRVATDTPNNCSCSFRIFDENIAKSLGFCQPQEWLREAKNDEESLNTQAFFKFIKLLIEQSFSIDSFVCWLGDENNPPIQQKVAVQEIKNESFAFFENHYFQYQ